MTRAAASGDNDDDAQLKEALAALISSTRSKRRPLPMTEIARWIDIAVEKLGTYPAVGARIGLSAKMLRQFSAVNELEPKVKELVASRKIDSVDAVAHLAMLPKPDQLVVATALAEKSIQTADVRGIVQLRQFEPELAAVSLLKRVIDSKTKREYVAEFVIRGGRTEKELLRKFGSYIPAKEIVRLETEGALGRLVLTDKGKRALSRAASDLGTSVSDVIPAILQKGRV
jgi:hypothetical protein